ncbi:cytochrome P460 family protein [Methanolobus sp. WCC4]|uniref:cytochrome P460 family protein n=1 Tax=Methanolobus sp. WCC4 TaxID=3125784 RepID=UPI0030F97BD8
MIKKLMFLVLMCVIAISGCTDAVTDEETTAGDTVAEDAIDASALFTMLTEDDNYKDWNIWPGKEAMMDGNGVHGDYVSIYVSDNALSAAEVGGEIMPYETFVVKEGFNSDEELTGVYLMYKAEGFDQENNDWFWAAYSPDGTVRSEGQLKGCIGCHEGNAEADYIFVNS